MDETKKKRQGARPPRIGAMQKVPRRVSSPIAGKNKRREPRTGADIAGLISKTREG